MLSGENFTQAAFSNNRLTGFSYDAAGYTTTDGINSYVYNAENQITSAAGVTYTYDGLGDRVKKSSGRLYWYGAMGIMAESDSTGTLTAEYAFFDGIRIARRDYSSGTVHYYFSDHLKSTSVVTTSLGVIEEESDFRPWGEEKTITHALADQHYKFNGKERDSETGFDEFGARLYSSAWSRWLTPDWSANPTPVPYAQMDNPQSLNLYGYAMNNPATLPDLDGHITPLSNVGSTQGTSLNDMLEEIEEARLAERTQGSGGGAGGASTNGQTPAQNTSSGGFFEKLGNWFHGNGWKTDAELHPSQSVIDKDKVANYMDAHANGTGNYTGTCAAACRRGLEAGGLNTAGHPVNAKDYGPFLTKHGAKAVSGDGYKPEKGDVAVFQGGGRNKSGHIEIYDGKQWVSDTKQPNFSPQRDYPGSSVVYRFPD